MPLMASRTLLNASVFALEISIIAMEAVLTPVGSPVSFARNSWLGTYPYGMPFSSQINGMCARSSGGLTSSAKNNELCSTALCGLGYFVASFLNSPALVCSDELVNTVGEVAWGFKSYVYTHWIHPRVVFVAPTLDHINAVPGYCTGEIAQLPRSSLIPRAKASPASMTERGLDRLPVA